MLAIIGAGSLMDTLSSGEQIAASSTAAHKFTGYTYKADGAEART
jgi:hypothetical protein